MSSSTTLRILHVMDATTPGDSLEMVALLRAAEGLGVQEVAALGHRGTGNLARLAGMNPGGVRFVPSAGWADPAGWRGLRKLIKRFEPTHVHAWGAAAAMAVAAARFEGARIATFTDVPGRRHMRVLRLIERRSLRRPFMWTGSSRFIRDFLVTQGLGAERTVVTLPGVRVGDKLDAGELAALKGELGLGEGDGPILLAGGEGAGARYDLALWTAGILQHMFPKLRTVVREDGRGIAGGGGDASLERYMHVLADEEMLIVASPEVPWRRLVQAADILFVAADGPIPVGSILAAMAGGVPVVAAPNPSVAGLVEHGRSGLIAQTAAPRALAAQLEYLLANPGMRGELAGQAMARVRADFGVAAMVERFAGIYRGEKKFTTEIPSAQRCTEATRD